MTIAMILSLLVGSGVCARTEFHGPDGATLHVIVCPVMTGAAPPDEAPAAPPAPVEPHGVDRRWPS